MKKKNIMSHNISVNKYFKLSLIFTIFILLFLLSLSLHLDLMTDDPLFALIIKQTNVNDFLILRYKLWGGRIPLEAIIVYTINYSFFWKLFIPLSLLLLATSIGRIICQKIALNYTFVTLIFLLLIPASVNANAAWWVTGFYFYLLPLSLATYAISFMLSYTQNKIEFVIACFSTFIFSYSEQIGIYFFCIVFLAFIIYPRTRNYKNFSIYILSLINYTILVTAPGNYKRFAQETWERFPDYSYYSVVQKLCFGFDKVHQLFVFQWNIPLIVFCLCLIFLYIVYGIKSFSGNISLVVNILFLSISFLQWEGRTFNILGSNFLNMNLLDASKWISTSTYISYFFIMMVIISLIILILSALKQNVVFYLILGIFIVGLLDMLLIGFSPTVYASSVRTAYIFEVCCVINCLFLIHHLYLLNKQEKQKIL